MQHVVLVRGPAQGAATMPRGLVTMGGGAGLGGTTMLVYGSYGYE